MIIKIRVIPNSKTESVELTGQGSYKLKIREKPIEGNANMAVVKILASYFKVKKANVSIIHGAKAREKTVEIIN
ncbi:MAG: DUF167 domain-containing protein [Candidatus Marsarchaeota archaeon]|jgi:uncharacterized protein (TIGR00251 family)|nr:DUF167 domain-containing protein [Candidatus Marsarchaeota archaeon]